MLNPLDLYHFCFLLFSFRSFTRRFYLRFLSFFCVHVCRSGSGAYGKSRKMGVLFGSWDCIVRRGLLLLLLL